MVVYGKQAERLLVGWLRATGWQGIHLAAPSRDHLPDGRVLTRSHDLFGCLDILAFSQSKQPSTWGLQVTTMGCLESRKRKVEGHSWPSDWKISVVCVQGRCVEKGLLLMLQDFKLVSDPALVHDGDPPSDKPVLVDYPVWQPPYNVWVDPTAGAAVEAAYRAEVRAKKAKKSPTPALKAALAESKKRRS